MGCIRYARVGSCDHYVGARRAKTHCTAYPEVAKRARLSGTVKVEVLIASDGIIKDVKVIGGHPLFVDATMEALKKWKYVPSNTEASVSLEFNFHP